MRAELGVKCLGIDHLHFYVEDAWGWGRWYQQIWGFQIQAQRTTPESLSLWLTQGQIHLILSQPVDPQGPVADYLQRHPQGIADVALQVDDAEQAYRSLQAQQQSVRWHWQNGPVKHLQVQIPAAPGTQLDHTLDLCHSLIERPVPSDRPFLPGFTPVSPPIATAPAQLFSHIDHVVINLPAQALTPIADWYTHIFNWQPLYRYTVTTQHSGLKSLVVGPVAHPEPPLLIALNEPLEPCSQIQEFIDANRGPGIQHVAFAALDILDAVPALRQQGQQFLSVPSSYYQALPPDLPLDRQLLARHQILVDRAQPQDPSQLLLQIFTQPLFPEPTFFYEIIQRCSGAQGFGEANFQALFEAIERQQRQRIQPP